MLKKLKMLGLVLAFSLPMLAQAQFKYIANQDYGRLEETIDDGQAPKVIIFFWYGCPHCYTIYRPFADWVAGDKPEDIAVEKVPAVASSRWAPAAQLFYTAEHLGLDADLAIFAAVQEKRNNALLFDEKAMRKFMQQTFEVSAEDFDKAWGSFAVQQKLKRARDLFIGAGLDGVPSFVVNGQYVVHGSADFKRVFDILSYTAKLSD